MTTSTNPDVFTLVGEFMEAFDTAREPEHWGRLIDEEVKEAEEAIAHLLKEICDVIYVTTAWINVSDDETERPDSIAAAIKLAKLGRAVFGDETLGEAFQRVHESNMSKRGLDGKPIYNEDGKVMKGPLYQAPDLLDLILLYREAA